MTTTTTPATADDVPRPLSLRDRLGGWKETIETANPPKTRRMDGVGTWLVITRAAVHRGLPPVILGETRARRIGQALMIAFYPILIAAVLVGWVGPWVLLVLLGLPRLIFVLRAFGQPRPDSPPHGYTAWPLWFVGFAFVHTRRAGGLLVLGLLLNAVVPITLPWG